MCEDCDALTIPQGVPGPQGPIGSVGPQGEQGEQGTPGIDGISIVWKGSLPVEPIEPELNWGYYNTSDKKSYIWDGDSWEIIAQDGINGTNGTNGSNGAQGDIGPAGPPGPQGEPGPQGDQGDPGFIYETTDGNSVPAEANLNNDYLRRNVTNTGYEFAKFSQLAADIQFHTNNVGFNKF
jgi:hypothetical protein